MAALIWTGCFLAPGWLLTRRLSEENRLLSPVSIEMALSLTANGAKDETLRQMEEVLGSNLDRLNLSMNCYREALSSEQPKVLLANSSRSTEK